MYSGKKIKQSDFALILLEFSSYLHTLAYADRTIATMNSNIGLMLDWHREQEKSLTSRNISKYYQKIQQRKSQRAAHGLSVSYINSTGSSITKFSKFLQLTRSININPILKPLKKEPTEKVILTQQEISKLYAVTYHKKNAFGSRDRAMLGLLYGCGLRRNELAQMNLEDVLLEKNLLFVSKGKGGKQRMIPLVNQPRKDVEEYLEVGRKELVKTDENALMLSFTGRRIQDFYFRIRILRKQANIDKQIGHHTFRHSIATHLLQEGMPLEDIGLMLGHSTLDSTQIYTHIANEL